MRILKVFNNSVVLVTDENDQEAVVRGKGIGFQKSPGDRVDSTMVERSYYPTGAAPIDRLAHLVQEIPPVVLEEVEKIMALAREQIDPHLHDGIFFPLADHLNFAIQRTKQGDSFEYPLKWEIASLYPREVRFAKQVLAMVKSDLGVTLPESESMPLALHLVNGQLTSPEMTTAMKVTDILGESIEILSRACGQQVNPDDNATSRFITHLRYLVARRMEGKIVPEMDRSVAEALKNSAGNEYRVAQEIVEMIESKLGLSIGPGEVMYLTVHVLRVSSSLNSTDNTI